MEKEDSKYQTQIKTSRCTVDIRRSAEIADIYQKKHYVTFNIRKLVPDLYSICSTLIKETKMEKEFYSSLGAFLKKSQ